MSDHETAVQPDETETAAPELDTPEAKQKAAMEALKQAIAIEKVDIGALRLKLTVTVPRETIDQRLSEQFAELRRDALIPGFRKGHAPVRLVEKRFAADVGDQLKTQLVTNGYMAAVERESLKPLGDPLFFVRVKEETTGADQTPGRNEWIDKLLPVEQALDHVTLPKEGPLTFSCEVELRPQFELPSLKEIPVTKPKVSISDQDVTEELRRLRLRDGVFKPVEEGPVARDDMLYTDMKFTVDGTVIAEESNFDIAARDIVVKGIPLRGLGDALIGKKNGDGVTFQAPIPEEHDNLAIRGKTANFEFAIREIKRLEVPAIDAEFLESMGYQTEDELRQDFRARMEHRLDEVLAEAMHEQIGRHLVERTNMEIPSGLSERQTNRVVARRMIDMYQRGVPESEVKKLADELRLKAHDQVNRDLKLSFIFEKIAEDQEIDVPEEEVNSAIAMIAARTGKRFDRVRDELNRGDGLASLYLKLRDRKILDQLLESAVVTEAEGPKKD